MSSTDQGECPICGLSQKDVRTSDSGERLTLQCARCGNFTITRTAARVGVRKGAGPKLSAWIRERTESGVEAPIVNSETISQIVDGLPDYSVSEKQLLLLRALERRSKYPGDVVNVVPEHDYPLAWSEGEKEFRYHLRSLIDRGLAKRVDGPPDLNDSFVFDIEITPAGWEYIDKHARPSVISDQVFVAMSFATELKPAWENAIRPALVKAGFRPYRIDAEPHLDRIDAKIITEIRNSKFLVVDVTQQRPGVYFEAGFANGLGLPVFWCVREDDLKNVHFDTRQYNHIVWKDEAHLADQLYLFVSAIVGHGSAT